MIHRGILRPLAHQALADRIPGPVLNAPSRGYQSADWFERFDPVEARSIVEEFEANALINELIDLEKMKRTLVAWPAAGFHRIGQYQQLAGDLTSALMTGLFILESQSWLE